MPIHERIYSRLANPPRKRGQHPALALSRYGARYATKGWFTKLVLFASFVPALVWCMILYFASQNEEQILAMLSGFAGGQINATSLATMDGDTWKRLAGIAVFNISAFQLWFVLVLTALVGSHQIAGDIKSHAFEVYLARPITAFDYWLGKILVVMRPLLVITVGPIVIVMVVGGLLLDGAFAHSWLVLLKSILVLTLLAFINSAVILGISSLGKSARYASVIWFALNFGSMVIATTLARNTGRSLFDVVGYGNNLLLILVNALDVHLLPSNDTPLTDMTRGYFPSVYIIGGLFLFFTWLVFRRVRAGRLL